MQDTKIASGALQGMSVAKACNPQPKPGDMFSSVLSSLNTKCLSVPPWPPLKRKMCQGWKVDQTSGYDIRILG